MNKIFLFSTIFFDFFPLEHFFRDNITRILGSNTEEKNFLIYSIVFSQIIESNHGGAIFFHSFSNLKLLIYFCSFISCNVTNYKNGGAMYIYDCFNSQIILEKNCGMKCYSYSNTLFLLFESNIKSNSTIIINELSLSNFIFYDDNSNILISIINGINKFKLNNFSNIKLHHFSGLYISNSIIEYNKFLLFYNVLCFSNIKKLFNTFKKI